MVKTKAKAIARRLGVIKAFQLKQATRTHTHTQAHTHTQQTQWNLEAFYSPFCCSLLSRARSIRNCVNKTTEAASSCPSYSPSLYLSLSFCISFSFSPSLQLPINVSQLESNSLAIHLLYSIKLLALCELIERWHHFESELLTKFDRFIAPWKAIFQ